MAQPPAVNLPRSDPAPRTIHAMNPVNLEQATIETHTEIENPLMEILTQFKVLSEEG
jgi:hypothetical protein